MKTKYKLSVTIYDYYTDSTGEKTSTHPNNVKHHNIIVDSINPSKIVEVFNHYRKLFKEEEEGKVFNDVNLSNNTYAFFECDSNSYNEYGTVEIIK